jgi:hypothetical protein
MIGRIVRPVPRAGRVGMGGRSGRARGSFSARFSGVRTSLTGDLFRMHLTVPKRLKEKLEAARDALSHSHR